MKRSTQGLVGVIIFLILFGLLLALVLNRIGVNVGKLKLTTKEKVGVLTLEGAIMDSRQIIEELSEMVRDKSVKAIVLRVDSPGGSVGPSQEIYKEVLRAREKKPVVVSMGGLAASGGYYVASAASKIVASPGTVTGSIGVITQFVNLEGLMSKIGVQLEVVKMGEYKDMGSPHRALTEKEREMISTLIQDIHQQFVSDVAKARDIPVERLNQIADGRIFSGKEAKELNLVDELGNYLDAINLAKEMANIKGEPELVYPKRRNKILSALLGESKNFLIELFFKTYMNGPLFMEGINPLLIINPRYLKTY